jgi:hypothetical protein
VRTGTNNFHPPPKKEKKRKKKKKKKSENCPTTGVDHKKKRKILQHNL